MANWVGSWTTEELAGLDQRGDPFYAVALDTYFGGAGARSWKDGIDTGGSVGRHPGVGAERRGVRAAVPVAVPVPSASARLGRGRPVPGRDGLHAVLRYS